MVETKFSPLYDVFLSASLCVHEVLNEFYLIVFFLCFFVEYLFCFEGLKKRRFFYLNKKICNCMR